MDIEGQLMRGLFKHERLKPAILHTDNGNVRNLSGTEESYEFRPNNSKWPIVVVKSSPPHTSHNFLVNTKAK